MSIWSSSRRATSSSSRPSGWPPGASRTGGRSTRTPSSRSRSRRRSSRCCGTRPAPQAAVGPRTAADEARARLIRNNFLRLRDHVILGTDAGAVGDFFGYADHLELELFVRLGMTPAEAIVAATTRAARAFGLTDAGSIEAGRRADFLVLDANPLDDITHTREIAAVYLRGVQVDRAALRGRWTESAETGGRPVRGGQQRSAADPEPVVFRWVGTTAHAWGAWVTPGASVEDWIEQAIPLCAGEDVCEDQRLRGVRARDARDSGARSEPGGPEVGPAIPPRRDAPRRGRRGAGGAGARAPHVDLRSLSRGSWFPRPPGRPDASSGPARAVDARGRIVRAGDRAGLARPPEECGPPSPRPSIASS